MIGRKESVDERKAARIVARDGGLLLKWVCPGIRGVPDRIFFPGDGKVYFIEWKREGTKRTAIQNVFARFLLNLGFIVYEVHSLEEFFELCRIERLPIYRKWLSRGLVHMPME